MHDQIVEGITGLAGIGALSPGYPAGSHVKVRSPVHNAGILATEFEC
ncbi:MAG: hypothetical protein LBU24_00035 [Methanocalculaceae archaeon]|jgi:hypothetical protein|nr:hypothetical protein [Methanocalculaceae archaeon]